MTTITDYISILNSTLEVKINIPQKYENKDIIFLHGAGMASIDRYHYITEVVNGLGYKTILFNFSGHGNSTGSIKESSLERRNIEAEFILNNYNITEPFSIIASSMGAYNAINIASKYKVERLILFCPAVYATEAYQAPFTKEFTTIIRKDKSWLHSDAFDIISNYEGEIIIIIGTNDEIIPFEVVDKILNISSKCKKKTLLKIDNAPHALHSWLLKPENMKELEKVISLIVNTFLQ